MYLAIAHLHFQPPIDTPALRTKKIKAFEGDAELSEVFEWVEGLVAESQNYTQLRRLELFKSEG